MAAEKMSVREFDQMVWKKTHSAVFTGNAVPENPIRFEDWVISFVPAGWNMESNTSKLIAQLIVDLADDQICALALEARSEFYPYAASTSWVGEDLRCCLPDEITMNMEVRLFGPSGKWGLIIGLDS